MELIRYLRIGEAARLLGMTSEQLLARERGGVVLLFGHRLTVHRHGNGAHRYFDVHELNRVRIALVKRQRRGKKG
jgi:DNA-binding transcriptional MerR regulator